MINESFLGPYKYSSVGAGCTIYHIPVTKKPENRLKPSPLLVMIPGNPGLVEFYIHYVDQIYDHYQMTHDDSTELEVLIISHINEYADTSKQAYTLKEQISLKVEVIENFIKYENGDVNTRVKTELRDVYILGHSVGAYMTQRIVKEIDTICNIKFIGLLFPTIIDISKSEKGSKLTNIIKKMPKFFIYVSWLAKLISCIPVFLLLPLLSFFMKIKKTSYKSIIMNCILKFLCNNNYVIQALKLSADEMKLIKCDDNFNRSFFKKYNGKVWCYFAHEDHWISHDTRDFIFTNYDADKSIMQVCGESTESKRLPHSFVLNHSDEFSKLTVETMDRMIK